MRNVLEAFQRNRERDNMRYLRQQQALQNLQALDPAGAARGAYYDGPQIGTDPTFLQADERYYSSSGSADSPCVLTESTNEMTLEEYARHAGRLRPKKVEVEVEKEEQCFMGEILKDVRGFIKEHRSVIYTVGCVLVLDHFFFNGKFKATLQAMVEKLLKKAEAKLELPSV